MYFGSAVEVKQQLLFNKRPFHLCKTDQVSFIWSQEKVALIEQTNKGAFHMRNYKQNVLILLNFVKKFGVFFNFQILLEHLNIMIPLALWTVHFLVKSNKVTVTV